MQILTIYKLGEWLINWRAGLPSWAGEIGRQKPHEVQQRQVQSSAPGLA